MSPRPNFRGRLRPALIFELGRIGSEHLPNDLPRDPKLPADRLDRPLLNEIRPADLRNRLHDQHPELGLHVPWKPVCTLIPGVPFGCRSPRKRGPYSTPIHTPASWTPAPSVSRTTLPSELCAVWQSEEGIGPSPAQMLAAIVPPPSIPLSEAAYAARGISRR